MHRHIAAAQAVALSSTELYAFFTGAHVPVRMSNPYEDRTEDVKEADALQHCGMRSEFACRHCHDNTCTVRKAQRMF